MPHQLNHYIFIIHEIAHPKANKIIKVNQIPSPLKINFCNNKSIKNRIASLTLKQDLP